MMNQESLAQQIRETGESFSIDGSLALAKYLIETGTAFNPEQFMEYDDRNQWIDDESIRMDDYGVYDPEGDPEDIADEVWREILEDNGYYLVAILPGGGFVTN